MSDVEHALLRQTNAARDLLSNLKMTGNADDAELVADTIEGETDLVEAIGSALDEIDEWSILCNGLKAKIEQDGSRLAIIERRIDRVRAAIEQAMVAADLPKVTLPTATLSIAKRPAGLLVTNEADIPSRFWVQPDPPAPKIDKKALLAALNNNEPIPGAGLDNGSVSLTVRRK